MNVAKRILILLAVVLAMGLPLFGAQGGADYDAFFVFGDSLADNGNDFIASHQGGFDPAVPPSTTPHKAYFKGRFSNGPVAFEYLWQLLTDADPGSGDALKPALESPARVSKGAVDFAFGGSTTGAFTALPGGITVPGLVGQVQMFHDALNGKSPSKHALYAILTGAGEYLAYLNPPGQPLLTPQEAVANIAYSIESLYLLGARDVLVLNLPDLGKIPLVAGTPAAPFMSFLSSQHNAALALALADIAARHPNLTLRPIDVNDVLLNLPASVNQAIPAIDALLPPPPGGTPMSLCLFTNPLNCRDVPTFDVGLQFLYWDVEHPTTAVHKLLAKEIYRSLGNGRHRRNGHEED